MVCTSGKSIRPKAYISFGISGATHHICGIKDSGVVISINRDEKAAIIDVSDILIAKDLNVVLDKLINKISYKTTNYKFRNKHITLRIQ